eukprot:scaffold34129_cov32-Tisochrysis_lutea.AAC.4
MRSIQHCRTWMNVAHGRQARMVANKRPCSECPRRTLRRVPRAGRCHPACKCLQPRAFAACAMGGATLCSNAPCEWILSRHRRSCRVHCRCIANGGLWQRHTQPSRSSDHRARRIPSRLAIACGIRLKSGPDRARSYQP